MKTEQHEEAYQEHIEALNKLIEQGLQKQRNIGFNVSQGSVELFCIYLHKLNLLQNSGDQFDHRVFKSENLLNKKVPPEFPSKKEILELMRKIEEERIALCYGNKKPISRVEETIQNFQKLRRIINTNLKNGK